MPAGSLSQAAAQCYAHMFTRWTAANLTARMVTFNAAIEAVFPLNQGDADVPQRTVANWCVIGAALEAEGTIVTSVQFNAVVEYVYRLLTAADAADVAPLRISVAQGVAILAAYNANLD